MTQDNTIDAREAIRLMRDNSRGSHVGKVLKEGGVLKVDGVMKFFTPAPPWVFRAMRAGVGVEMGAWCRRATAEAQPMIDKLLSQQPKEGDHANGS